MSEVTVQIFEEFADAVSADWVSAVGVAALSVEHGYSDSKLGIVIADDESVADLNESYRGLHSTTDVLSFSSTHSGQYYGEDEDRAADVDDFSFILPPDYDHDIGEIIISYPQAVRQAREAGLSNEMEVASLLAHGIFHLLGYDHESERQTTAMRERERAAVHEIVLRGLLPSTLADCPRILSDSDAIRDAVDSR